MGSIERLALDWDYLQAVGVLDRVPRWREICGLKRE